MELDDRIEKLKKESTELEKFLELEEQKTNLETRRTRLQLNDATKKKTHLETERDGVRQRLKDLDSELNEAKLVLSQEVDVLDEGGETGNLIAKKARLNGALSEKRGVLIRAQAARDEAARHRQADQDQLREVQRELKDIENARTVER